ncbi:hypothetical protein HID58_010875 [Brassica napus]|uniref:DUF4378 domain-containing protein n=1 Tax=Brassica napus TaxID=3708 RepID=A0ABQ8DYI1_BRANA|nr:hypothetical protein HID58_010875 [Brassica napus]
MSAKLLYNLSDENPNLNKQFGCMNGILQVFYRQHYPARPVSGHVEKSLPSAKNKGAHFAGERKDLVSEINMESDKETLNAGPMMPFDIKELVKGSINREVRSRRDETTAAFTQHQQQPNSARASMMLLKEASLRSPSRSSSEWNEGRGMAARLRESPRFSYDEREMRNKTGSKLKETPRLSLDSRSSCPPEEPVTMSHRRSNSSVVAKLMGLEVIADNFDTEQRNENRFCDSPRPMSRVEPTSLGRSRSVGSIKKLPAASKFPLEPAPWKQMKAGDAALTVYGEIQKRLTQLEFKKAGKDLRALKQILEAMEKTQQLMDGSKDNRTQQPVPPATSPAMNFRPSSIVVMKPAAPVSTSLPNVNVGNPRQIRKVTSGKQNAMDLTPRPGLYKSQQESTKSTSPKTLRSRQVLVADSSSMTKSGRSQQQSVSPRRQPKKLGFERQSPPTTPKSEPGKIQRQLGRQQMESVSPRRKQGIKPRSTLQQPDERLGHASSDLRSLRTDSSISLGSSADIEVTSRHRLERNCGFPELHTPNQKSPDFGIRQDRPSLKPLKVTVEQPSPVSVLDAAFDEEDSPSPVRKISLSFKEDDALRSEESVWIKKPASVCRSIILPENNRGPTQPDSELLKCFSEEDASGDHKYISEILLASGLLRDLEYSMISIQLNKARLPINPGLFFILEQNKGMGLRQHQTDPTEIIRRKLIFDTVNEILAQRFTAEGCTKPQLTANPISTMENISKGEQLLKTLCLEIDRLQENNSQCILEDDKEDLIWNDLQCHGMNLKAFEGETPGIVLDIERMIFRDLVNEVCFC